MTRFACFALLVLGCGPDDSREGELGNAEFAWDDGVLGCLFGCDAGEPMVEGGFANLRVTNASDLGDYTVGVDGALIDAVGTSRITLEGGAAGSGKVYLDGLDGDLIDRFRIDVAAVERIEVNNPELFVDQLTVLAGGDAQLTVDVLGDGEHLKGYGGIEYELIGGISESEVSLGSALADAFVGALVGSNNEYVRIDAIALGAGQIRAVAVSGVELTVPVAIIDEADLTGIELQQSEALRANSDDPSFIDAKVLAGVEPVHGAACDWSIEPAEGPITASFGSTSATLEASAPATAILTCTIGDHSADISVEAR